MGKQDGKGIANTACCHMPLPRQDLQEELLTNGLSLPGITISPHLADFTVGAALMTAAHGSSLVGPASIAAYVIKAILVDGTGGSTCQGQASSFSYMG
jgi:hypothetical protein